MNPLSLIRLFRPVYLPSVGWLTLGAALGLTAVGLAAIDLAATGSTAAKQLFFLPVALVGMALAAAPPHKRLIPWAYPLFIATLVLLLILPLDILPRQIVPVKNGARRWYNLTAFLGGREILFQPSELAKIVYVLSLACYLRFRENYRTIKGLVPPVVLTFLPMGLILVEPDLGTAMIFMPVLFAMLLTAGAKLKHLIAAIVIGLALMPAMYPLLQPHQKARIVAMVSQLQGNTQHRAGIGFQGYKAQTLVGAGRMAGHEREHAANLVRYNRLPESHNDMIFAVICTRFGLLGGAGVIGLYLIFIAGGLLAAALNKEPAARLIAVGVTSVVFTQMFVNIGMTVGVLPITGMTLPFVSYGGSSLVANFMIVGLILNVAARRPIIMANPAFEFDSPKGQPVQRNPYPGVI